MKGFPKNRFKLHSAIEQKPVEIRYINILQNKFRMMKNKVAKRRAKKK